MGSLEFPYRLKITTLLGIWALFGLCLAALIGLGFAIYTGIIDWAGWGRWAVALVLLDGAVVVLVPFYLYAMRGGVVRLTSQELTAAWYAAPPSPKMASLPLSAIESVTLERKGRSRLIHIRAGKGYSAIIAEGLLPNADAFDEILGKLRRINH